MANCRTFSTLVCRVVLAAVVCLAAPRTHSAWAGTTVRVSVSSNGEQANRFSASPAISADGRYVAFETQADNLVPDDTETKVDIFVHDLFTGETTRVSVSSSREPGNDHSHHPSLSADGRYVAFDSDASNLVHRDTNRWSDVFVHDRTLGETTRVSVATDGGQGNRMSSFPTISADGRYVAFFSIATDLVPDDTNQMADIFLHDRETSETQCISVSSAGDPANGLSNNPRISASGRYIAFHSHATSLVEPDTNGHSDIFLYDRVARETTRVSNAWNQLQGDGHSDEPSISSDGRYVAFHSFAGNLVQYDTNDSADVFVVDRQANQISRVSVSSTREQGNDNSRSPSISADGQFVTYESSASNLVSDDTTGWLDIFVHDRRNGETIRTSFSTCRILAEDDSDQPRFNNQGQYVAFASLANNLVPNDTNDYADIFVHEWEPVCLCSQAEPPGTGSITRFPNELCLPAGTVLELTAHPEGACEFVGWSGGIPVGHENNNPVFVPLEISTIVTAHFGSTWGGIDDDCNGNGEPDGCDGLDCNNTGLLDECDVLAGTSPDCNENLNPDECDTILPGDFDTNGQIDLHDYRGLPYCLAGPSETPHPPSPECVSPCLDGFDFDFDGDVDLSDVSELWSTFRAP